jgi:hypothetical protein
MSDDRMYCYVGITRLSNQVVLFWYRKDAEEWMKNHVDPTAYYKKRPIS